MPNTCGVVLRARKIIIINQIFPQYGLNEGFPQGRGGLGGSKASILIWQYFNIGKIILIMFQ